MAVAFRSMTRSSKQRVLGQNLCRSPPFSFSYFFFNSSFPSLLYGHGFGGVEWAVDIRRFWVVFVITLEWYGLDLNEFDLLWL